MNLNSFPDAGDKCSMGLLVLMSLVKKQIRENQYLHQTIKNVYSGNMKDDSMLM